MCNLYQMTPKGDAQRFIGKQGWHLVCEAFEPRTVGPSQAGVFLRSGDDGLVPTGKLCRWGMLMPGSARFEPGERLYATNNTRIETVAEKPTFSSAWRNGQRCLIPAAWYQEPNWESGKNVWWHLRRADGAPWFLAGLWSEWTDKTTGEFVPNFTMLTCNCDDHPLLSRLHKPDPTLAPEKQDKRAVVHIAPGNWDQWLQGTVAEALALVQPPATEVIDPTDADRMDQRLNQGPLNGSLFNLQKRHTWRAVIPLTRA